MIRHSRAPARCFALVPCAAAAAAPLSSCPSNTLPCGQSLVAHTLRHWPACHAGRDDGRAGADDDCFEGAARASSASAAGSPRRRCQPRRDGGQRLAELRARGVLSHDWCWCTTRRAADPPAWVDG